MTGVSGNPTEETRAFEILETTLRSIGVRSALLLGSTGKGERPLVPEASLAKVSDLDIACIGPLSQRRSLRVVTEKRLGIQLGQEVTLYVAHPQWSKVRRFFSGLSRQMVFPTLFEYDRLHGSRLLFGPGIRQSNSELVRDLPPAWEGVRLMLNHSAAVLESILAPQESPDRSQLVRSYTTAKVVLAGAVFLELRNRVYHGTSAQRVAFLQSHPELWTRELALPPNTVCNLLECALNIKSNPALGEQGDFADALARSAPVFVDRITRLALGVGQPFAVTSLHALALAYLGQPEVAVRNLADLTISKSVDAFRVALSITSGQGSEYLRMVLSQRTSVRHLIYSQVMPLLFAHWQEAGDRELSSLAQCARVLYLGMTVPPGGNVWHEMATRVVKLWNDFCQQ